MKLHNVDECQPGLSPPAIDLCHCQQGLMLVWCAGEGASDAAAEAAADKASAEADTSVWRVTDGQGADSAATASTTGRREASGRLDFVLQVRTSHFHLSAVVRARSCCRGSNKGSRECVPFPESNQLCRARIEMTCSMLLCRSPSVPKGCMSRSHLTLESE